MGAGDVTANCGANGQPKPVFSSSDDPAPIGPWRYKVINTVTDNGDEGLRVRTCNVDDCPGADSEATLGVVKQNHTVFVVCTEDSGFKGGEPGESIWYKVKWPTNRPSVSSSLESSRDDPYTGWMFGTYLSPSGHNGKIADCKDVG